MVITAYRPLSAAEPTFPQAKVTDLFISSSYKYHKYFYQVGSFTLVVPANVPTVELISEDMILSVDGKDSLIVTDISSTEKEYTFKGYDLKYLLHLRLTLFPQKEQDAGTYGYYVTQGSTEHCIKDLIQYNITAAADKERRIYGFYSAANQDRGLESDTYMTRLEYLDEVVAAMCKNASVGYDIKLDFENNKYLFDVAEPVDRTDSQHDRNSVVFAKQFCNVIGLKRETGTSSEKNAIYAINGGGTADKVVKCVLRDKSDVPAGVFRREVTVNTSAELATEVDTYALKEAEDYVKTDSFELDTAAVPGYGVLFDVGDKVTFKHGNLFLDSVILEAQIERSGDSNKVTLVAGNKKPKTLNSIGNKTGTLENNVNSAKIDGMSGDKILPLSQFAANEDGSYTVNGVNYKPFFNKAGKITTISDSKGNIITTAPTYAAVNSNIDFNTMFMTLAAFGMDKSPSQDYSVFTFEITEDDLTLTLPALSKTALVGQIDWDDGELEDYNPASIVSHTYAEAGTYQVKIYANIVKLANANDSKDVKTKCTSVILSDTIVETEGESLDYGSLFRYASKLSYFRGGNGLAKIASGCFSNCSELNTVILMNAVTFMTHLVYSTQRAYTFNDCVKLKNFVIPIGTTNIPPNTFQGCSILSSVYIPKSVSYIDQLSFSSCGSLTINYQGTEEEWNAMGKHFQWNTGTDIIAINYNQSL